MHCLGGAQGGFNAFRIVGAHHCILAPRITGLRHRAQAKWPWIMRQQETIAGSIDNTRTPHSYVNKALMGVTL